jgi:limonene-1,2-epoxide hydrolase
VADNAAIIRDFVAAWSRLDADELVSYFTQDGIYHNMMLPPVQGHAALKPFIAGFAGGWQATTWELRNLAAEGDLVFTERLDRTTTPDGKQIDLPCCGVFEMRGGKIAAWRDYFDMGTYTSALAG